MYGLDAVRNLNPRSKLGMEVFNNIVKDQSKIHTPLIELYINLDDGKPPIVWKNASVPVKSLRHIEREISELRYLVPEN